MAISSCTASPEAVAICSGSFGTSSALRQATVPVSVAAISATIYLGDREAARQEKSVNVVGSATLIKEPSQGEALNPFAPMFGIYGISKERLEGLQDLLLVRYCSQTGAGFCSALKWQGWLWGNSYTLAIDREPTSVNTVQRFGGEQKPYYMLTYDRVVYPGFQDRQSDLPWELVNTADGERMWGRVSQEVRDAAAALATPEEEWGIVSRQGELGSMSPPAGYDPANPSPLAGPISVEISGTDRVFRQPATIPGTTATELGGPLIQEGDRRRVGVGYPDVSGFVPGGISQPGANLGQGTKPLTFAGTNTTGGEGQYKERKVGFPLPGPDGQLDSDDEISIPPTDVCAAPCIQDIKKKLDFATDYCEELWEYFLDYSLEDYRLPPNNFFFDIGSSGHPLDTIIAASIIREEDVPDAYGRFITNFAIAPFHPKNIGLLQFEYAPDIDRGQGELGVTGFRIRSEPQQVRGFSLVYPASVHLPCKAVGWSPRTGISGRLRVFVRRYQLKQ